ncbi:MAG: hypothetical protein WCQ97_08550 [Aminobacterium sp.]|nr:MULTISPECIES: hypothetical protein [unclassified Aminobacterium]MDD2206376.1 hypothetical protein [Aminobacterium sp.]MDD3426492.1 hypothetical protein [Aminobacterium sp.]MDD3707477.1 hypothetical protein [Aminobacterium sp.]MDD4228393.1 hypothetical protein [Aminobacterium sp.]MDD4552289.1 hypothetical protein [Aminobacterium sp.]
MVKAKKRGKVQRENAIAFYEVVDSIEMFNSEGLIEVRWRGPFEGYR